MYQIPLNSQRSCYVFLCTSIHCLKITKLAFNISIPDWISHVSFRNTFYKGCKVLVLRWSIQTLRCYPVCVPPIGKNVKKCEWSTYAVSAPTSISLFAAWFIDWCHKFVPLKFPLCHSQGNSPMKSQHRFRYWFGTVKRQATTWAYIDLVLCRHHGHI